MYELTKSTDLSYLIGTECQSVDLNKKIIRINLWKKIDVIINTTFLFNDELLSTAHGYRLHVLITKKVINASIGEKYQHLIIEFEGGNRLELYNDFTALLSYIVIGENSVILT